MKWLDTILNRWRIAREARRENYLKALANAKPGHQWILAQAGTDIQARSPMLADDEIRDWFREYMPGRRIVELDEKNKIVFYE